ncbi:MAG TPA: excinuclease ABC subunit UvrA [Bryobacteraceae bacterium]|nr:excinuclease ABC subunit UvrA [Bryobacteraceae bacterium]
MTNSISIHGARVHNLKNVSLDIPHEKLTVVTGVSGSGKSSLAFDTIYAEGQRRYVESLSAYARQFLERMEKPDVDEIMGISPPIAIRQKNTTRNPRSTVATATELYDFLRLLWARAGRTFCPNGHGQIVRDNVDRVATAMLAQPEGSRWYALFPIPHETSTDALRDRLFDLRKKGFSRLFQNGRVFEFSTPESLLEIDFSKPVFALVDRLAISPSSHQRIVDTVEICYREGAEAIFEPAISEPVAALDSGLVPVRFSEKFDCKICGTVFQEPEPSLFSFNSPVGACKRCQGFGNTIDYDLSLVVPDRSLSIAEGAVDPWTKPLYSWYYGHEFVPKARGKVRLNVPFFQLRQSEIEFVRGHVRRFFKEVETKKYKVHVRVFMSRYRGYTTCPDCGGSRLRPEALYIRVGGKTLAEVAKANIAEARDFFCGLTLSPEESAIAEKVLVEIQQRLKFLNDVGLEYLTLDRLSATLSGGEAQRIQLATCLGSRLVGATYVLDEPSIGLHSRDTGRLIRILEDLRDLGNTILVVEHDRDVMSAADHIVDLGPGAGEQGGRLVFEGPFSKLLDGSVNTLTSRYLRGDLTTRHMTTRRRPHPKRAVRFLGAQANNLKGIDVTIPLNLMVAITGVSGSGKSTLVHDVIYQNLVRRMNRQTTVEAAEDWGAAPEKLTCHKVEKADLLTSVVLVDQSPIGRTPRSNPVTYIKAFELIRELFSKTTEAGRRGYSAGHFSFNIPGGRCETCQGDGTVTVEMQFLADVELVCEDCHGTRYKPSVLDVRYHGLNIHEVLQLTVREAISFFSSAPKLAERLKILDDVGLGYLRLGQSATTLSGGEAQRVKLAAHLAQSASEGTLYIFDEPTTGLHFDDIAKLLASFERLLRAGASVLVIEHNLDVIRSADWVIDLGPEGGEAGGRIVAEGTPEQIAAAPNSYTGQYLAKEIHARHSAC